MMQQFSWLQAAYFALGGLELVFVLALLGIAPALVDPMCESQAKRSAPSTVRD
jgi:hypothetical protein